MTSIRFFLFIILLTCAAGCNKTTPAGFWNNFNSRFIKNNLSDQGPYGGHRAIYWDIENSSTLNAEDFVEFAIKKGWTLIDSADYDSVQTSQWIYDNKQIFPISNFVFDDEKKGLSIHKYLPRWFDGRLKLYRFKTGWITIEPETDVFL